jgi:hypothetical protein
MVNQFIVKHLQSYIETKMYFKINWFGVFTDCILIKITSPSLGWCRILFRCLNNFFYLFENRNFVFKLWPEFTTTMLTLTLSLTLSLTFTTTTMLTFTLPLTFTTTTMLTKTDEMINFQFKKIKLSFLSFKFVY